MTHNLTIHLPVPVPAIKTISRWRVFLALFNPRAHFTTCTELQHQLYRETEVLSKLSTDAFCHELNRNFQRATAQRFANINPRDKADGLA